jgi:predicted subunit of tRNA(5-methylaminomethyl-2-thiouridylate) methyltransferase
MLKIRKIGRREKMPFKDIVYTGESISNSKLDSTPQSSLFSITYIQPVDEYTKNEVRKLQQKVTKMEQEFDIVKERIELEHKARTLLESEVIKEHYAKNGSHQ